MAYLESFICKKCEKAKHEVKCDSEMCHDCRVKEINRRERVALAGLKGLTTEERLEKLEKQVYDLINAPKWWVEPRY